jgi:hypothetical protein
MAGILGRTFTFAPLTSVEWVTMAIPARLSRALHSVLGEEGADDLVNWMTQVDSNRSDLRELTVWAARADVRFDNIDARLSRVESRLDGVEKGLTDLRVEVKGAIADVETRLLDRIGDVENRLLDRIADVENRIVGRVADLFKWSFVFWCGAIGVGLLTRLLK